jgi:hypothetical protein
MPLTRNGGAKLIKSICMVMKPFFFFLFLTLNVVIQRIRPNLSGIHLQDDIYL